MLNAPAGQRPDSSLSGPKLHRWSLIRALLLGILLAAVTSIVLLTEFFPSNQIYLDVGDVSPENILAPTDLTYESTIRTQQEQGDQAALVADIYDLPDTSVARQQSVRARQIMDFISTVRKDPYASLQEKTTWIAAVPDLSLTPEVISQTLNLDDDEWQEVKEETDRVLTQAMQGEIKESQVASLRRRIPTLIGHTMTDDQSDVVQALAGGLVTPNTFYNAARTEEARQTARDNSPPVTVTIRQGEAIVRAGDRISLADIEALDAFGLRQQAFRWQALISNVGIAILVTLLIELLIFRLQPSLWTRNKALIVTFLLIALFVIMSKLMLPLADTIVPYLYPLPALSMILSILFGPALGMAISVIVGILGGYIAGGGAEITVYLLAGALMGAMSLGQAERLKTFLRAGLSVAMTNAVIIFFFGLLGSDQDLVRVSITSLVGIVSGGMAASLALAAFFALSAVLDVTTAFQLIELSRPTHPLFRQLLLKAPGTYHHTLLVANMAEEAAERIGADGLLTRVGTYYHDIGKTMRPYFFTENRIGGVNPHERLDPRTSAQIIINHVTDGLELAEKYRLPTAIRNFIPEHHGTSMTLAFYRMAVKEAGDDGASVDEQDFRYPGPKPQSRETAITMLADNSEARVRSAEPASVKEIERIIETAIKDKLESGQLDESDLTLRDLKEIQAAFVRVLKGVFHPRVKYPEPVKVKGPDGQEIVR